MPYTQGYYPLQSSQLHYIIFGKGKNLLIAFHGFADDATLFTVLEPSFGEHYTVISLDLPFHGMTKWDKQQTLSRQDITSFILNMMKTQGVERVSLAGFSLGGKLALSVFEMIPGKVDSLWLLSPDGLKNNIWYNLAVYPKWGQKLFRRILYHPERFLQLVNILHKVKVVPSSLNKFLQNQMQSHEKRELAWNIWMCIKGFEIPQKRLRKLFMTNKVKGYLFFGKYDSIITVKAGRKFSRGLENIEIIVLDKGHNLLKEYLNPLILQRIS